MALITLAIAAEAKDAWWVDPVGAIAISLVIIYRWVWVAQEQVRKGGDWKGEFLFIYLFIFFPSFILPFFVS